MTNISEKDKFSLKKKKPFILSQVFFILGDNFCSFWVNVFLFAIFVLLVTTIFLKKLIKKNSFKYLKRLFVVLGIIAIFFEVLAILQYENFIQIIPLTYKNDLLSFCGFYHLFLITFLLREKILKKIDY